MFPPAEAETYMPLVAQVVQEALSNIKQNQHRLDKFLPTYKISFPHCFPQLASSLVSPLR